MVRTRVAPTVFLLKVTVPDYLLFFFFNDAATTEIYTLPLHDALPIYDRGGLAPVPGRPHRHEAWHRAGAGDGGRSEEPRLNSSHLGISYAVFCLKKKRKRQRRLGGLATVNLHFAQPIHA